MLRSYVQLTMDATRAEARPARTVRWRRAGRPVARGTRRRLSPLRRRRFGGFGFGGGRRGDGAGAQGAARRHPHRGAAAARRGAAQRLPDHAGGRGAQRRRLAPEPRLGLPAPCAARGRGPDPLRGGRRAQALRDHRRGPRPRRRARPRAARAVGADERRVRLEGARARQAHARGRRRPSCRSCAPAARSSWSRPQGARRPRAASSTGSSPTATSRGHRRWQRRCWLTSRTRYRP